MQAVAQMPAQTYQQLMQYLGTYTTDDGYVKSRWALSPDDVRRFAAKTLGSR
jgi:hypothetical protein